MCITRRYLFICRHPASHRFRNAICESAGTRGCTIKDYNYLLQSPCKKCAKSGTYQRVPGNGSVEDEQALETEWHVPTRCFIDIGFRSLDPFEEDRNKVAEKEEELTPENEEPPSSQMSQDQGQPNMCMRIVRRLAKRRVSPCCKREAQKGAFETCRLESRPNRINGSIKDDYCESKV